MTLLTNLALLAAMCAIDEPMVRIYPDGPAVKPCPRRIQPAPPPKDRAPAQKRSSTDIQPKMVL